MRAGIPFSRDQFMADVPRLKDGFTAADVEAMLAADPDLATVRGSDIDWASPHPTVTAELFAWLREKADIDPEIETLTYFDEWFYTSKEFMAAYDAAGIDIPWSAVAHLFPAETARVLRTQTLDPAEIAGAVYDKRLDALSLELFRRLQELTVEYRREQEAAMPELSHLNSRSALPEQAPELSQTGLNAGE